MFFAAALAVAAASASMALAQDVSINDATLTQVSFLLFSFVLDSSVDLQCQNTTVTYNAPDGSYYAAGAFETLRYCF
jgi:hypothetical protein